MAEVIVILGLGKVIKFVSDSLGWSMDFFPGTIVSFTNETDSDWHDINRNIF